MITTITAITNVEVVPATSPGIIQELVDGITFPFTGAANERLDVAGARWSAAAWAAVGAVIGSKATRSRLNSDPEAAPVLGIFF
jgi:hypothetical protein